jgi:MYXO-CTERM domain-containing protein
VRLRPGLLLFAGLAGCDAPPELISEREDFRLKVRGVTAPGFYTTWERPYLVLEGTRMCPELECWVCPDEQTCDEAAISVSGAIVSDEEGCFVAQGAGEAVWTVGSECGAPGMPPDRVVVRVVAADEAAPLVRHENAPDAWWEVFGLTPAGATWPGDVAWPMKVVAESQVVAEAQLVERASGDRVAWSEAAAVSWTTTRGRAPIVYPERFVELVAFVGTEAEASLAIGEYTWPIGQVVGVSADEAVSLEISANTWRVDGELAVPGMARVVARDAEGALLSGMPVRWSVEGDIGVAEVAGEAVVFGDCRPPAQRGGPRVAVLKVRYGELSGSLTLRWQGAPEKDDPNWSLPDYCADDGGCDCRSGGMGGMMWLALVGLALGRRRRRVAGAVALAAALPGCAAEGAPSIHAKESLELGDLALGERLHGTDGGRSVGLGGGGLWVFHEADIPVHSPASLSATLADVDGSDGLHPFAAHTEEEYARTLIPLSDDEREFNQEFGDLCGSNDDCQYMSMWPGALVHDAARGRVLIFYGKRILRQRQHEPSFVEQLIGGRVPPLNEYVGTGIAVWDETLAGRAERALPEVWDDEPTLLFRGPEPRVGAAALIDGEFLYSYACDGEDNPCIVARVELADALQRTAWRFLDEDGQWVDRHQKAQELFPGAPALSVHFSEHAGAFVAVYAVPRTASVVVRTAPRPEGPWSGAEEIHRPFVAVPGTTVRNAVLHPELAREGGAIDYLTYMDAASRTLQLAEIVWE